MIRNAALPAWQAKWIDPELPHDAETRQPASYLRKCFSVADPASAYLYITCHGLYAAFLNGKRVGNFVLAPGTGDYHKRLTVQCYDVTKLLNAGENELLVILGNGWYRGNVGIDGLRATAMENGIEAVVLESHKNWIGKDPVKSLELSAKWLKERC